MQYDPRATVNEVMESITNQFEGNDYSSSSNGS